MAKLGQIEAVAKDVNREADTFDMLGETFEVAKRPSLVDSLMSAAISADTELSDAERFSRQIDLARKVLEKCLSAASYARFFDVCEENELGVEIIWQTVELLVGAAAGRPTGKPSDSSGGQSNISTSSSPEPVGLMDYAKQGLHLVPVEDWAREYMPQAV